MGQFITLEQFSTLATAFQEAQQHTFKLSGDSANYSHFSAQTNKSFAFCTYVQQLEERPSQLEQKSCNCGKVPAEYARFQAQIANIASRIDNLQQQ